MMRLCPWTAGGKANAQNDTSVDIVIDDPASFHHYLHYSLNGYTYGPYFLGAFFDTTGRHNGSSTIPSGCPTVVFDGLDPFDPQTPINATPVTVERGETIEIMLNMDDSFISP